MFDKTLDKYMPQEYTRHIKRSGEPLRGLLLDSVLVGRVLFLCNELGKVIDKPYGIDHENTNQSIK